MKIEFDSVDKFIFGFQCLCISKFKVQDTLGKTDEQVITEYINNKEYSKDAERQISKDSQIIGSPFRYEALNLAHFKRFNKKQLWDYLYEFRNKGKWNIDERVELNNSYSRMRIDVEKAQTENYYVINMDWFDKEDAILYSWEANIHFYFIHIFWFDKTTMTITACELAYN